VLHKSEKGIVLVMVLMLSAIALALMTALIYMVMSNTQISGLQKRYKTSLEAGRGGNALFLELVGLRGDSAYDTTFNTTLSTLNPTISAEALTSNCTGSSSGGTTYLRWQAKLLTPTTSWSNCNSSIAIDPSDPTTYDMQLVFGAANTYNYYAKIVNTIEGNTGPNGTGSGGGSGLVNSGVVSSGGGEIQVMQKPYLYVVEVMSVNKANTSERSKFSILYQY
jgi:hypothetical protein